MYRKDAQALLAYIRYNLKLHADLKAGQPLAECFDNDFGRGEDYIALFREDRGPGKRRVTKAGLPKTIPRTSCRVQRRGRSGTLIVALFCHIL